MKMSALRMLAVVALATIPSCSLKYELLKDTSLVNPPSGPIKIYVREFPVDSKASVVDPRVATAALDQGQEQYITNELARSGNKLVRISRPSRLEDLSGAILRELRRERVRVFAQYDFVDELDEDSVREINNPFELVAADEADLEISGSALILSQKVRKVYSQYTQAAEVQVEVKDLSSGSVSQKTPINAGINMVFNSRELEEALVIAVMTSLTQKLLF